MNKVKLVGRLTRDAELNERSETKVCDMRIAVNGPGNTPPLFIDLVAFNETAESSASLKKGDQVQVKGALRYSEWSAKDAPEGSRKRSKHSVIVRELATA
jgi:single stranded DNA-binding protein